MLQDATEIFKIAAIGFEGVAAFSSIVYFKKYKQSWLLAIPIFLFYSFISELISELGLIFPLNNNFSYNILAFITFNYFLIVYYCNLKFPKFKKTTFWFMSIYVVSFFTSMCIQNIIIESLVFSYSLGGTFIIVSVLFYFIEKLSTVEVINVQKDLLFWISIGFLLFYVGYIPIKITRQFFSTSEEYFNYLRIVQYVLVILMNAAFSIGFYKSKWN